MFRDAHATQFRDIAHDFHQTVEKDHGRIETRRCWTIAEPSYLTYLNTPQAWKHLRTVVMVEAERQLGATSTLETRYLIASLENNAHSPCPPCANIGLRQFDQVTRRIGEHE